MKPDSIKQIKARLAAVTDLADPLFEQLKSDPRKGVATALKQRQRQLHQALAERAAFFERLQYERTLWQKGVTYVAGVDEVGRGPLAGPVVAGAVIIPQDFDLLAVNDSKKLTPHRRAELAPLIQEAALATGIGIKDNRAIDDLNIYQATRQAMKAAVLALAVVPNHLIVDAMQVPIGIPQTRLVKADAKSISVAAASIIAKVDRDRMMDEYAKQYPEYEFDHNAGYGTAAHLAALAQFGATPIHRRSFAPVQKLTDLC